MAKRGEPGLRVISALTVGTILDGRLCTMHKLGDSGRLIYADLHREFHAESAQVGLWARAKDGSCPLVAVDALDGARSTSGSLSLSTCPLQGAAC